MQEKITCIEYVSMMIFFDLLMTGNIADTKVKKQRKKELKKLDGQVWETIEAGYKQSSMQNIKSQYESYERFCNYFYLQMFPADMPNS